MTTQYVCLDCGRRFYNKGWHAEACGSGNYEPVIACTVDESAGQREQEIRRLRLDACYWDAMARHATGPMLRGSAAVYRAKAERCRKQADRLEKEGKP